MKNSEEYQEDDLMLRSKFFTNLYTKKKQQRWSSYKITKMKKI